MAATSMISPPTAKCFFNECDNDVDDSDWKCHFHKHRSRCLVDACHNQVYARNLCVRHGGKKACSVQGCSANARVGSLCSKHATPATKKVCMVDGCTKQAHARYKCVRHGGGSHCKVAGCTSNSRSNGMCSRHGKQFGSADATPTTIQAETLKAKCLPALVSSFDHLIMHMQPIAFDQTPAFLSTELFDIVAECFHPSSVVECDLMHL
ncbi:Aste57867_1346 [Aphanomyces stellatus]|uniref:Aste57867_1346 protein n=1 Tax=Aphanomyces stellatus TaxID=120398 RepID=A0A485KA34_9STRA|nr:hypothetical protein As57867_001345 [Aphanomyces stellatus]VFT78565.1 Aste57867_1346 [Aphanomyces stellatus]